uniref:Uncharacterized protein n=1 Tax=Anguilla anguilla TaxID=7936 RepID=A0A0E9VYA8_ANGAN
MIRLPESVVHINSNNIVDLNKKHCQSKMHIFAD